MNGLTVLRWRKYGKDRLYVTAGDGIRLGWHDLATDESHAQRSDRAEESHAAVAEWRADGSAGGLRPASVAVVEPAGKPAVANQRPVMDAPDQLPVERGAAVRSDWEDLAARHAGAMARRQAVALNEAAPVRTFVARMLGINNDERAWRIGADGEEKVAAQLAKLARKDPRWRSLNAIAVGRNGSDIDHLLIGPGGIFTLNAKHHPGGKVWVGGNTLMVNGVRRPYLRNSWHEAARASRLLTAACGFPVLAAGVVVPVGADDVIIETAPAHVYVVDRMGLVRWLRGRVEVLDEQTAAAIFAAARRSTTWCTPT